jgi:hypothetical protein
MAAAGTYTNENMVVPRRGTNWGAIWAGVFTAWAIWSVFGMLGIGVFASAASARAAHPITGMTWGESVWVIVLTAISMYVGGLVTGRLAAVTTRHEGAAHGQAMFGLGVAGALLFVILATTGVTTAGTNATGASVHNPYLLGAIADVGWAGFVALFLGWIGAMLGGSHGQRQRSGTGTTAGTERPVQQIRNVA